MEKAPPVVTWLVAAGFSINYKANEDSKINRNRERQTLPRPRLLRTKLRRTWLGEKEAKRQRDRKTERERERDGETEREREKERTREKERERGREKERKGASVPRRRDPSRARERDDALRP